MNRLNFNTKKRNCKHLSEYERGEIQGIRMYRFYQVCREII